MYSLFTNISLLCALLIMPLSMQAQGTADNLRPEGMEIRDYKNISVQGHFSVGPTRFSLRMDPGETRTVNVQITNREGKTSVYLATVRDFEADTEGSAKFLNVDGPFHARSWITPHFTKFQLDHGEQATIPVTIRVPEDASAGDHQAAVVLKREEPEVDTAGMRILSSVASLFLITVNGDILEDGSLTDFSAQHTLNWNLPVTLNLTARNDGSIHFVPAGTITIRNVFGAAIETLSLKDWAVLRESERVRSVYWHPPFAIGPYTATADLALYSALGEISVDPIKTTFWVLPIGPILLVILAIMAVAYMVQYIFSRFEIKRK